MPDSKISGLSAATNFLPAYELPVNDGAGNTKKVTGTQIHASVATPVQFNPADPAGSTSQKMMGLGTTCTFTPKYTRIFVMFSGDGQNTVLGDGVQPRGYYGTGTAPANGAAVTGSVFSVPKLVTAPTGGYSMGWSLQGVITGLTPATAYWFDIALAPTTGGTATIKDIDCSIFEV